MDKFRARAARIDPAARILFVACMVGALPFVNRALELAIAAGVGLVLVAIGRARLARFWPALVGALVLGLGITVGNALLSPFPHAGWFDRAGALRGLWTSALILLGALFALALAATTPTGELAAGIENLVHLVGVRARVAELLVATFESAQTIGRRLKREPVRSLLHLPEFTAGALVEASQRPLPVLPRVRLDVRHFWPTAALGAVGLVAAILYR